jgi:hypothetical protein
VDFTAFIVLGIAVHGTILFFERTFHKHCLFLNEPRRNTACNLGMFGPAPLT